MWATGIWAFSAKATELVPGLGVEDAVTGEDHRPLRLRDLRRRELQLAAVGVEVRPEAGQAGDDLVVGRVGRGRLLLEGVLRDVDVDRARAGRVRAMWNASARTRGRSFASRTR